MSQSDQIPQRQGLISRLFLEHPGAVNESYFAHMHFAASFGFWLMVASLAAFVHAVIPALCETTGSRIIRRLHARIENRH